MTPPSQPLARTADTAAAPAPPRAAAPSSGSDTSVDLAQYDAQIIGNQERRIAHWKHEAELWQEHHDGMWEEVAEMFNAPDSDSWHPLDSIREAVAFIEARPCTCPPGVGPPLYEEDPCQRCGVLNRHRDQPCPR